MGSTLRIIASGLTSQQRNLDVIANNIANLQTPGFKRTRLEFKDLAYRALSQIEADEGQVHLVGGSQGSGVQVNATQLMLSQGTLQETHNPLDLALDGPGFFAVQLRGGTLAYTRAGNFALDAQNRIVNHDGLPLAPGITLPEGATLVRVDSQGVVWAQVPGGEIENVGQIVAARFANPEGLAAIGHNLFVPTVASGPATTAPPGTPGYGVLHSGALEQGNVDLPDEIARLLQAQRAYQLGLRALHVWDQIAERAVNVRR